MADKKKPPQDKRWKKDKNVAQSGGCGQSKLFKRSGSCGQSSDNAALHRMALIHALNLQHPHVGRANAPRPQRTCDLHMLHEGCLQALKHFRNSSSLNHKLVQNVGRNMLYQHLLHIIASLCFCNSAGLASGQGCCPPAATKNPARTLAPSLTWGLASFDGKTADMKTYSLKH